MPSILKKDRELASPLGALDFSTMRLAIAVAPQAIRRRQSAPPAPSGRHIGVRLRLPRNNSTQAVNASARFFRRLDQFMRAVMRQGLGRIASIEERTRADSHRRRPRQYLQSWSEPFRPGLWVSYDVSPAPKAREQMRIARAPSLVASSRTVGVAVGNTPCAVAIYDLGRLVMISFRFLTISAGTCGAGCRLRHRVFWHRRVDPKVPVASILSQQSARWISRDGDLVGRPESRRVQPHHVLARYDMYKSRRA